jgi:hypothetical protein
VKTPLWKRALPPAWRRGLAAALVAAVMFSLRPAIPSAIVTRFPLVLDRSIVLTSPFLKSVALSPDGTRLVYVANRRLYVRSMSDFDSRPIPGPTRLAFIGAPEFFARRFVGLSSGRVVESPQKRTPSRGSASAAARPSRWQTPTSLTASPGAAPASFYGARARGSCGSQTTAASQSFSSA